MKNYRQDMVLEQLYQQANEIDYTLVKVNDLQKMMSAIQALNIILGVGDTYKNNIEEKEDCLPMENLEPLSIAQTLSILRRSTSNFNKQH